MLQKLSVNFRKRLGRIENDKLLHFSRIFHQFTLSTIFLKISENIPRMSKGFYSGNKLLNNLLDCQYTKI